MTWCSARDWMAGRFIRLSAWLSIAIMFLILVFIAVVAVLLVVSKFPVTGNIKFLTVVSGSMEPTIKTGSVVMVKPAQDYKVGDIITFGPYTKTQSPVTHRIYEIKEVEGQQVYITKGDANNGPDSRETKERDIIGKVAVSVPFIGYVVDFAKTTVGFALIIFVPAIAIISDELKKIYAEVRKNKK